MANFGVRDRRLALICQAGVQPPPALTSAILYFSRGEYDRSLECRSYLLEAGLRYWQKVNEVIPRLYPVCVHLKIQLFFFDGGLRVTSSSCGSVK